MRDRFMVGSPATTMSRAQRWPCRAEESSLTVSCTTQGGKVRGSEVEQRSRKSCLTSWDSSSFHIQVEGLTWFPRKELGIKLIKHMSTIFICVSQLLIQSQGNDLQLHENSNRQATHSTQSLPTFHVLATLLADGQRKFVSADIAASYVEPVHVQSEQPRARLTMLQLHGPCSRFLAMPASDEG